jgi:hypothetical protein
MKGMELAAVEKIVGDKSPPRHSSMQSAPPRAPNTLDSEQIKANPLFNVAKLEMPSCGSDLGQLPPGQQPVETDQSDF